MIDIFSLLLSIIVFFGVVGVIRKTILAPPKVWIEDNWMLPEDPKELKELKDSNYDEMRKENPHIWID